MTSFHLTVAKVGETLFEGSAVSVTLPGASGVFTVLAKHEPFVSELAKGKVVIETEGNGAQMFEVEKGIAEVSSNQVTVLL